MSIRLHAPSQDAEIEAGTTLYRLASITFSSGPDLLNGRGAMAGEGRYHYVHQATSYCSDNVLVCFAEVLYHMSRQALDSLANNMPLATWLTRAVVPKHLVVFEIRAIPDLVNIDTDDCRNQTAMRARQIVGSSLLTHPDMVYDPLQQASNFYRRSGRNGVVYPSARHSRRYAIALYADKTSAIVRIRATLDVTLKIIDESTGIPVDGLIFDPSRQKVDQTRGYYQISSSHYHSAQSLLVPNIPISGIIDFSRRLYVHYPTDAVS